MTLKSEDIYKELGFSLMSIALSLSISHPVSPGNRIKDIIAWFVCLHLFFRVGLNHINFYLERTQQKACSLSLMSIALSYSLSHPNNRIFNMIQWFFLLYLSSRVSLSNLSYYSFMKFVYRSWLPPSGEQQEHQKTIEDGNFYGALVRVFEPLLGCEAPRKIINQKLIQQQLIDRLIPMVPEKEYSKLLKGIRYAIYNILTDQKIKIDNHLKGSYPWRVDVVPVHEYFDCLLNKKTSYAIESSLTVIQLPQLQFSGKEKYFKNFKLEEIFTDLDNPPEQYPEWVLRIKKIWNLLFLVEKILENIETGDDHLIAPENLVNFNHAYNLLFDLDINVFDFLEKITQEIKKEGEKEASLNIYGAITGDHLWIWLSKSLGYYLGLVLTQLGSTDNILSFANQTKEVLPHILGEVAQKLNTIINALTTKGPVSLEPKKIKEIENETKKILVDINQFLEMHKEGRANFLEIIIAILNFISNPDRSKVLEFFKYLAKEHQTLCMELIRYIKYAFFPAVIGLFEDIENAAMLEPGSIVFYIENYSQKNFEDMVYYLNFHSDEDMKTLYTLNWLMIRESQIWKKVSILQQNKEKLAFELKMIDSKEVPLSEKFKVLYSYFVQIDSALAESIRLQLQNQPEKELKQDNRWEHLASKVKAHISAKHLQSQEQITLLQFYVKTLECAKKRKVCYFEIQPETRLNLTSLSKETQQNIKKRDCDEQAKAIDDALILLSIDKLKEIFRKPPDLFKSDAAVIKFADYYFCVHKKINNPELLIEHLPESKWTPPFPASSEKSVFLPGKVIEKLEIDEYGPIVQSKENSRFTLDLDENYVPKKKHFTLDQLSSDELHLYSIAWQDKINKIKQTQLTLANMIEVIRSSSKDLVHLQYDYSNLQGVFQFYLSPQVGQSESEDRFTAFQSNFYEHNFKAKGLLDNCQRTLEELGTQLKTSQLELQKVQEQYKARYKNEKKDNFPQRADERAGYLLHTQKYSTFFEKQIEKLHQFIKNYGSPALKTLLASKQNLKGRMYNPNEPFPQESDSTPADRTTEIYYLHNCLFYLKRMYCGFELQKKYAVGEPCANEELVARIFSIVDFFQFYIFASNSKKIGKVTDSLHHFVQFNPAFQFVQRYEQIYGLRDVEKYAFLNGPLVANQVIIDLFSQSDMRNYLISGQIDKPLEQKITALLDNKELIMRQFQSLEALPIFQRFKKQKKILEKKIASREKDLKELESSFNELESSFKLALKENYQKLISNKSKRLISYRCYYAIQKKSLANLYRRQSELKKDFDQLLADRTKLILHVIEKFQQSLTQELNPIEKIILKLISGTSLKSHENRFLDACQARFKQFYDNEEKIQSTYQEILLRRNRNKSQKSDSKYQLQEMDERLFTKILTRKNLGLPLEFYPNEFEELKKLKNDSATYLLLDVVNGKYRLKSLEIDFREQYALELRDLKLTYPFKPVVCNLSFEEILKLPQVQNSLMRNDIYEAYLFDDSQRNASSQENLMSLCEEVITQSLQELRVIEFRSQKLKELHLASKQVIKQYELYAKGHHGFLGRYVISLLSRFLSSLRQSIVTLRLKTELNIGAIKDVMGAPILAEFDRLEIQMGLKPGQITVFLEKHMDAFINEFSKQISSSPIYTPLLLADRSCSLSKRLEMIKDIPDNQASIDILEQQKGINDDTREENKAQLILNQFKFYTEKYCEVLMKSGHLKVVDFTPFLLRHLEQSIQNSANQTLRAKIYNEIQSQEDKQFGPHSPKDSVFCNYLRQIVIGYMKDNAHHFKMIDELMQTIEAFEKHLEEAETKLQNLEDELKKSSLGWGQFIYLQLEYFYQIRMNYELDLNLIQQQKNILSRLKSCLKNRNQDPILNVITDFATLLNDPNNRNILKASAKTSWYLGKFLLQLIYYVFNTFIFLLNCVLPHACQIRFMTPKYIQYQEDMEYTLKKQDFKFDLEAPLTNLFESPQNRSPWMSSMFRGS